MINRVRSWLRGNRPGLYAILDTGTVEVKALLLLLDARKAAIVGAGRQPYEPGAVIDGGLADPKLVVDACERALSQAEAGTETVVGQKLVADQVVIGVPGLQLASVAESLAVRRQRPRQPLDEKELCAIIQRAERAVLQEGREEAGKVAGGSGEKTEVGLVDADIVRVAVDGLPLSAAGARGAQVDLRVCSVFAPASYLSSLTTLAHALEMEVEAIWSTTCSIARSPYIMGRGDAIVIDVGGECTDVVVVRHGGIDGLRSLPLGAVTFTRRTGRAFGVPLPAAEEIKRAYAAGALDAERTADLRTALASDIATWVGAVLACLSDLSADEDLPGAIYLCGAGAALPDIEKSLRSQRWLHALPFAHEPGVLMLKSSSMAGPDDQARLADKDSFVGALALATRMMRRARMAPIGAAQQALQRVLDGMRLS